MTPHSTLKRLALALILVALIAPSVLSAQVTHIIDSHPKDEDDVVDVTLTADWEMKLRSGKILREFSCLAHDTSTATGQTLCPNGSGILDARELVANRHIQQLNVQAVIGFWRNAQQGVSLPVVLLPSAGAAGSGLRRRRQRRWPSGGPSPWPCPLSVSSRQ